MPDHKTGDSLNYAFIEFETQEAAEAAYEKMNNVIIDDRRIKVDFSQSAHKQWRQFNLQRRENQINKRREMARDMKSSGALSGPSSQVVGGNDYQREVTNKWAGTPGHSKEYSASVESKLGGFRDRKEGAGRGAGRGGRFDVQGSSGLGPGGRGMGAVVPAWKTEQRVKEEESGRDTGPGPRHRDGVNTDARDGSGHNRGDRATEKRDRSTSRDRDLHRRDRSALPPLDLNYEKKNHPHPRGAQHLLCTPSVSSSSFTGKVQGLFSEPVFSSLEDWSLPTLAVNISAW